jgi:hypothetical protein
MSITIDYKRRQTVNVRVDLDGFELDIKKQSPEQVILQWGADEEYPERCDIGQLCYLDRLQNKKHAHVNISSLCEIRKKSVENILLTAAYMSHEHICYVRIFINFIDQEFGEPCDISNEGDLKSAYISYTKYLQHLLQLSKINISKKGIGSKSASRKQHGAIKAIQALLENISEETIKPWAPMISRKDGDNNLPTIRDNNDHYSRMFAIHLRVFIQVTDFLLKEETLPLILNIQNLGLHHEKLHIWSRTSSSECAYDKTNWKHWGLQNDKILDWPVIVNIASNKGISLEEIQYTYYRDFKKNISDAKNRPNNAWTKALVNRAISSFCYGLIADSGCNWTTLRYIDFDNIIFVKELDKTRLISLKIRADSKAQHIEMTARFKPIFRRYQKLREWMKVKERYGIFKYGDAKQLKLLSKKPEAISIKHHAEYLLRSKVPWVGARDWRWNVSYEYLDASGGDVRMVSRVLGNEQTTVRKHYGFADFESSAKELTIFYRELAEYSRRRVRISQELIPVNLNDDSARTLTGGCEGNSTEDAILVKGFTSQAPQPTCDIPATCFMCENYALHADEQDFRKILSVKYWLEIQGRSVAINDDEFLSKYQPIIDRIEEILAQALLLSPEVKFLITLISQQVDAGQYDPYWQVQIDALIDGGFF